MRWTGHVALVEDSGKAFNVLVEKPQGIIPAGRSRRRWDDGIEIDLKGMGCVHGLD
jgi:hypothetical protein